MKYEYGVEYETNGEKPDLPGDVMVEFFGAINKTWRGGDKVSNWTWGVGEKFRIVDERYKPKESATDTNVGTNWHEKGELPPVGAECEVRHTGEWKPAVIVGYDGELPVFKTGWHDRYVYGCGDDFEFRPLPTPTERDVLVEKCTAILEKGVGDCEPDKYLAQQIVDAGWRPVKQQTEEEFVSNACTGYVKAQDMVRAIYRAGCRFVERELKEDE